MTLVNDEVWPEDRDAVKSAVLEHFGLDQDEAVELLELALAGRSESTDYFQFTSLIKRVYTLEQKTSLVELLWKIAYANQDLHRFEEHVVRKISNLLHGPHSAFIAAKLKTIDNPLS
jgi:uncharacterized tellurite resistance protein B-like protein